ncbi:MAG: sugar phosphate isomerase/epimerase family protein [Armatimonadota bacterium]
MAKIAIGSWAYMFGPYENDPVPLDEVLDRLSDLKFDGVELAGFTPHASPQDYPTKADRQTLKSKLADHRLEPCGYAANLYDYPPASDDPTIRQGWLDCFKENAEFCVDVGIPAIRVDTANGPPLLEGVSYEDCWNRVVSAFHSGAQIAQDAGIKLVWEFEPGFMFNKPSEIVRMIQDVDHPNFTVLFDTCHAHMCSVVGARQSEPKETLSGGAVELAQKLTGKIGHVHLIDSDETLHDDETSTHAPFGTGVLDFDEILPAILRAGYDSPWWSIDLCFWPEAWEVTEHAKRFVDELNEKYG